MFVLRIIMYCGACLWLFWVFEIQRTTILFIFSMRKDKLPEKDYREGYKPPFLRNFYKETGKAASSNTKNAGAIVMAVLMLSALYLPIEALAANTQIGSIFERQSYEALYYVNVYEGEDDSIRERCVAEIERTGSLSSYLGIGGSTPDEGYYSVKRVYIGNGYYVNFVVDNELVLNSKERCTDREGRIWYVELTGERAEEIPEEALLRTVFRGRLSGTRY